MDWGSYRGLPAVNASSLKMMSVSPLHYRHGLATDRPDTPAMAKGRAIHTACLEPLELPRRYTVWPGPRRGRDWTEFATVNADKEILTGDEYDDVVATQQAVLAHPVASWYLTGGVAEQTITWTDFDTGLHCKARLDYITKDGTVVDLKSARDISSRVFERQTHDLNYHVQAAHYVAAARAVGIDTDRFVFVAVESGPPHDVRCGPITEDALYCGEQERMRLLRLVRDCTESGQWPGAFPEETPFDLPGWFYAQAEAVAEATL